MDAFCYPLWSVGNPHGYVSIIKGSSSTSSTIRCEFWRKEEQSAQEAALDGSDILRTSLPAEAMDAHCAGAEPHELWWAAGHATGRARHLVELTLHRTGAYLGDDHPGAGGIDAMTSSSTLSA